MALHVLKVQPPYFEALLDGSKTFEVRKNDRAYQRDDVLVLREFTDECGKTTCAQKHGFSFTGREVQRRVAFVYSGDPRFGGIEPGFVVLGLAALSGQEPTSKGGSAL